MRRKMKFIFTTIAAAASALLVTGNANAAPSFAHPHMVGVQTIGKAGAPIIKVMGAEAGIRATLARRLEKKLKKRAIALGKDPSKIRVDPFAVPFNINRSHGGGGLGKEFFDHYYDNAKKIYKK